MADVQSQQAGVLAIAAGAAFIQPQIVPGQTYALLIDNNRDILLMVMALLELEGYAAHGLTNSLEVLPFLKQLPPDQLPAVLLMDVIMPGLTGFEIAQQLAQDPRLAPIPIVIMTGEESVTSIKAIPGATAIVSKPFHLTTILAKLAPFLSHV